MTQIHFKLSVATAYMMTYLVLYHVDRTYLTAALITLKPTAQKLKKF
jgi:hypothetical protein